MDKSSSALTQRNRDQTTVTLRNETDKTQQNQEQQLTISGRMGRVDDNFDLEVGCSY